MLPALPRFVAALGVLVFVCGCAKPAAMEAPELSYAVPAEFAAVDAAPVREGAVQSEWWRGFRDARLTRFLATVMEQNPTLQASAARIEAAQAQARLAGAGRLPQVSAGAQVSQSRFVFTDIPQIGAVEAGQWGVSLDVAWEADIWGEIRKQEAAALTQVQTAMSLRRAAMLSLTAQSAKAWFAAIEAREQVELALENLALLERTVNSTEERFAAGLRPSLDYRLALTQYAQAEAAYAQRDGLYQIALRQLDILAGRYPRADAAELSRSLPTLPETVPVGLPSELLVRRPDVLAAERNLAAAHLQVDAARAALLPRLSFAGSTGLLADDIARLFSGDAWVWNILGNLFAPVFQGGRLRANVSFNEALAREALAEYVQTTLAAFVEVETALALESRLAAQQTALEEALAQAAASAEIAEERYELGLTDILTLLVTQRELNDARSALLLVMRQRLDNRVDLHLALGGGFEDEVATAAAAATTSPQ